MQDLSHFPKVIKTPRLTLQTVLPTDENAKAFFDVIEANREYLEAWQGHFEYLRTIDEVRQKLEQRYNQISQNENVLFGIYLNKNLIGNGFMSEALNALEQELFKFGFTRIKLDIDNGNKPSESLAKRNGYILENRLPMASWAKAVGKCDSLIYIKQKANN